MTIIYKGKEHEINARLLVERQVEHNLFSIILIRNAIANLFEAEKTGEYVGMEDEILIKLKDLEFKLQEYWGFPRNESYHFRQFNLAGCLCPKMDNKERIGVDHFVFNGDCPYHGFRV